MAYWPLDEQHSGSVSSLCIATESESYCNAKECASIPLLEMQVVARELLMQLLPPALSPFVPCSFMRHSPSPTTPLLCPLSLKTRCSDAYQRALEEGGGAKAKLV